MTFLFGIGRVLLDFDFETSLARLLPEGATDGEERMALLLDRKDEFETGSIPESEYIPWATERMGINVDSAVFIDSWRNIFTPIEPMWRVVEKLAADGRSIEGQVSDKGAHRSFHASFTLDREGRTSAASCTCPAFRRAGIKEVLRDGEATAPTARAPANVRAATPATRKSLRLIVVVGSPPIGMNRYPPVERIRQANLAGCNGRRPFRPVDFLRTTSA